MRAFWTFLLISAGFCAPVLAGPLTVRVVDPSGRPVTSAVVTVRPAGAAARPMKANGNYSVTQKNLQFHPFVSVVPQGATVSFPNLDPTKHHVYSFSPAKRFELKLFAKDQSRSVRFDRPGVIALGCNIHDAMSAFIVVTDSAWTAMTDSKGFARFADFPPAPASMTVWHPYLREPGNQLTRRLAAGDNSELVAVRLRPAPMHDMGGY
jgi:plastocyanin